jgi:hypothetical protein
MVVVVVVVVVQMNVEVEVEVDRGNSMLWIGEWWAQGGTARTGGPGAAAGHQGVS